MRALPLVLVPLLAQPALAADREGLFGTWRLASFLIEDAGAETGWRPIYGEHPKGYLVLTPDGHLISVVTGEGRTARSPPPPAASSGQGTRSWSTPGPAARSATPATPRWCSWS